MASIENSLKHESEVEPGKVRLVTSGEFVRAYNHSAWLFYCCISKYKVIRKYSKAQQKDIYFLGFPVSKLLELANGRACTKTDFGYDITLKPDELPAEEGYEAWTKEAPVGNCRVLGDRREWNLLPKEKSLFHSKPGCGLPIGNLSSQLFSNIYLGALDDFMKRELKCRHYGRYVDDMYVVASTKGELYGIVPKVRDFLCAALDLELNEDKVRVVDAYKGVEFLGAYLKPYRTYPARRSLRRMRGRMKSLFPTDATSASLPVEGPQRVQARVNSMLGVLSHYDCWHIRKVVTWQARLRRFGKVTDDCLRFYPYILRFQFQMNGGTR